MKYSICIYSLHKAGKYKSIYWLENQIFFSQKYFWVKKNSKKEIGPQGTEMKHSQNMTPVINSSSW